MPKIKTHSGAKKRFKKFSGGYKYRCANRNHILTKDKTKAKRQRRGLHALSEQATKLVNRMLGRA